MTQHTIQALPSLPAGLPAVHQQPTDLTYAVLQRTPPCPLTVLSAETIQAADWRFTFRIIGESHWITAEREGDSPFHELLACVPLPVEACTLHYRVNELTPYQAPRWPGYQFALWFEPITALPLPDAQLQLAFPPVHGQTPFTCVAWRVEPDEVVWQTLHLYPHESGTTSVYSTSRFRIRKDEQCSTAI